MTWAAKTHALMRRIVFTLPDETFLEILSYFPAINFRYGFAHQRGLSNPNVLSGGYAERCNVLRAITQTCRALRQKFLPWLWEGVDACAVPYDRAWYVYLGNLLENKCRILLKNPVLAAHVRLANICFLYSTLSHTVDSVMSVTLSRHRMNTVLPTFASCLQSLPNLHTLGVCHAHRDMTTKLEAAFKGVTIPSIRTIVIPTVAHNILRSCPNVEDVTCNDGDGSQILSSIASKCPKVKRISDMNPPLARLKC